MITFKKLFPVIWALIVLFSPACAQNSSNNSKETAPAAEFPLTAVESVPVQTDLATDGIPKTHQIWKDLLSSAQESISLGMFYMVSQKESRLEEIINIVEKKAAEGVKVRIVTEKVFYEYYPQIPDRLDKLENVEVHTIDLDKITGGIMHAKYFIVDGLHFYIGSANFDWRSLQQIREIGIAGTSADIASDLLKIFNTDFKLASLNGSAPKPSNSFYPAGRPNYEALKTSKLSSDGPTLSLCATPPQITSKEILLSEPAIIKIINSAKKELFIDLYQYGLTSSYSPVYYDYIDRAIRRAASNGVKIKFLISNWALTENQQAILKSLQVLPNIEVRFIAIPEAEEGHIPFARVSHTKLLIADGKWAWTGSANWQPGYFHESRNVGLVIKDVELVGDLVKFFSSAWESSSTHYLELDKSYSPPKRQ